MLLGDADIISFVRINKRVPVSHYLSLYRKCSNIVLHFKWGYVLFQDLFAAYKKCSDIEIYFTLGFVFYLIPAPYPARKDDTPLKDDIQRNMCSHY